MRAYVNAIETEVPNSEGHGRYLKFLPKLVQDPRTLKLIERLASKAQIESRYSVLNPSETPGHLDGDGFFIPGAFATTEKRMRRYQKEALPLAEKPIARLLANFDKQKITHLVHTSCTGFYAPGLDLEIQAHFGLRTDLERTIIGFMGCYAAFNAMKTAFHIIRSQPDAVVLIVNLELCSLHLQDTQNPEKILGALQFADGCAASLISAEPQGLELLRFRTEVSSQDRELIKWNVGDQGFDMSLSMEVPSAIGRALEASRAKILSADERAHIRHWAIHPGGRSILDAVQRHLELGDEELRVSREVLRRYGNMSSATIMFVLREILMNSEQKGRGCALAFGPGLTIESLLFEKSFNENRF